MKSVVMDPAGSRQPSNVFSPAGQYAQVHAKLSTGAHHMALKATQNELYEQEVACFIDGTKVGVLHENEAYDYYQPIRVLNENGFELVVPCRVTNSNMIYYRPLPRESLKKWVAETVSESPLTSSEDSMSGTSDTNKVGMPVVSIDTQHVSSRINRHVLKLLSQDWFSPLDMPIMNRFIYGLYWHEQHTVPASLGIQQSNALVLVTYALHRSSSESVVYDQTVRLNDMDKGVIVVQDSDVIEAVTQAPHKADLMARAIMAGAELAAA